MKLIDVDKDYIWVYDKLTTIPYSVIDKALDHLPISSHKYFMVEWEDHE